MRPTHIRAARDEGGDTVGEGRLHNLGFDAKALRERFAFYYDRFPIREETH